MTKKVVNTHSYFEIKEKLGEGLTSQVYKAFRCDPMGITRQPVALKIIKSEKSIQFLKHEFESLQKVSSPHCVKVLGWETLGSDQALILEFIDGVTVYDLYRLNQLQERHVDQIMDQTHQGIEALHASGLCHGDLNLKNIMVSVDGVVQIIDFGFYKKGDETLVTPDFASEEILSGEAPSFESDFYAISQIRKKLLESHHLRGSVRENRTLSELVHAVRKEKAASTCVLRFSPQKATRFHFFMAFCLSFAVLFFVPAFWKSTPRYAPIKLSSNQWMHVTVNQIPWGYSPIAKRKIRHGRYRLFIKQKKGSFQRDIHIPAKNTLK
ncbi:MAG: protein kinase [Pseudomonadota bacterium]